MATVTFIYDVDTEEELNIFTDGDEDKMEKIRGNTDPDLSYEFEQHLLEIAHEYIPTTIIER
jgi:hypothetical protein